MIELVAIEISAPEPARQEWVAAMLDACNTTLERGSCVSASDATQPLERSATITWSATTRATVRLHDATSGRSLERTLRFHDDDDLRERWRMVGFTTALLADDRSHQQKAPAPDVSHAFYAALSARVVGASGLSQRGPKLGAQLRVDARPWQAAWLLGVSAEYTRAEWAAAGIAGETTWSEVGAGATALWYPASSLELFTRIDIVAQRLQMTGHKKRESESARLWQPGVRLAVDVQWPLASSWFAVVGAHGTVVLAPVALRVDDKASERVAPAAFGFAAGVQYRF